MEKETNKSKIIFITALVCIVLCIPIGVLLGRTLLGKDESNKTNNNIVNNDITLIFILALYFPIIRVHSDIIIEFCS